MRKTLFIAICVCCLSASDALAVKVGDITRVGGQRRNFLTGLGLVVGLNGTGDGNTPETAGPLRELLANLGNPITAAQLGGLDNVALVTVEAVIPNNGVREGDEIDIHVQSTGGAASLKGGRLFVTPLRGPVKNSPIVALAQGAVEIEDPSTPTTGVIKKGAVMEVDMTYRFIENGRF